MSKYFDMLAYLMGKQAGGGGDISVVSKSISSNGTFTAPSGKAYSPVTVSVPASAVDTGTKSITSNGTGQDVVGYAAVDVAVPNSYAAGDEGKVVSNGALVSQTAHAEVTANGTIDTTLNNSVVVNVSGGGAGLEYEEGTYTPAEDIAKPIINFVNSHTEVPIFVGMIDTSSETTVTSQSDILFLWFDPWKAFDSGFPWSPSDKRYETAFWLYMGSSTASTGTQIVTDNSDDPVSTSTNYARYWVTNTGFKPNVNSDSRYWRSGRTYKWIAVWAPTA